MYAYISGILDEIDGQQVIINANGIGYQIFVPGLIMQRLPSKGNRIKLYTYMHLREDCQELYGFLEKEEKNIFEKLVTVSGVGPKAAMGILSTLTVSRLVIAIISGDKNTLCKAPGIGRKTAERIILELKDKIDDEAIRLTDTASSSPGSWSNERMEAFQALQALGYGTAEAESALAGLEEKDVSTLIRRALRNLDNRKR